MAVRPALHTGMLPESIALFQRFTSAQTYGRRFAANEVISRLKVAGIWDRLDALYILGANDLQAATRNWKANAFNLTQIGTGTFTPDRGWAGNGVDGHLTTGYVPSAQVMQATNAHISFWSRNNVQSSTQLPIGARTTSTTGQLLIAPRLGTDVATFRVNQDVAGAQPANVDSTGFWFARRAASNVIELFKNGVLVLADTAASTTVPTVGVTLGALNTGDVIGSFATHQIAAASIGRSLDDTMQLELYRAVLKYLQIMGAA